MKRIIALLMLLCLGVVPACACAEGIELSAYSDAELIALLYQVQDEIVSRNIEKTAQLTGGIYVAGQDIPAGRYILSGAGTEDDSGIISLSSVNDPAGSTPSKLYDFILGEDAYTVAITLEEGDTLVLPYAFTLTISAGVVFR